MNGMVSICWAILLLSLNQLASAESCSKSMSAEITLPPVINGWGLNAKNHRFIAEVDAGIAKAQLEKLKVKWVFAMPDTKTPHTQPLITPDTIFIGDEPGMV